MAPVEELVVRGAADSPSVLPGLPGYNPDNLQPWTVQVATAMTILAVGCVILRIISRRLRKQKLEWDDRMIIFSVVGCPLQCANISFFSFFFRQ
jgi:hypothetical protein